MIYNLHNLSVYCFISLQFYCLTIFSLIYFILQIDSVPKHLIAEFNLGCLNSDIEHTYRVYVTTFLGMCFHYHLGILKAIHKNCWFVITQLTY